MDDNKNHIRDDISEHIVQEQSKLTLKTKTINHYYARYNELRLMIDKIKDQMIETLLKTEIPGKSPEYMLTMREAKSFDHDSVAYRYRKYFPNATIIKMYDGLIDQLTDLSS